MQLGSPDPLAVAVSSAIIVVFIPDHVLFSISKSFYCRSLTDHKSVISVLAVFSIHRIRSGKIIHFPFLIVCNAWIGALFDQRILCICKVCGAADDSGNRIFYARSACVYVCKIICVPTDGVVLFRTAIVTASIRGIYISAVCSLIQRCFDLFYSSVLTYCDLCRFCILKICIVRIGELTRNFVILRLSQFCLGSPYRILRRIFHCRDHEVCRFGCLKFCEIFRSQYVSCLCTALYKQPVFLRCHIIDHIQL